MYLPETARLTVVSCTPIASNFAHGHRLQMRRAVFEKVELPRNDLLRDVGNGLLPLVNRSDQEFAAADFVADVIFDFAVVILRDDVFVEVADPQMRNLLVV